MQSLKDYRQPSDFRGRPAWFCQLWWVCQSVLFATSPQFMYGWRIFLLRCFGAKIGIGVKIRPTARITFPWKLDIGSYSWIGDHVELYSLGKITIGCNTVISQRSYICTGSHDTRSRNFSIYAKPIMIKDGVWLATDVFVAPGVVISDNVVVSARSTVTANLESNYIYSGNPAKCLKAREFYPSQESQ